MAQSENSEIVIAIRFGGEVRELIGLKSRRKGDTYVFPPYASAPEAYAHLLRERHGYKRAPLPPVDLHMSKHHSGEHHLRVRLGRKDHPTPGVRGATSTDLELLGCGFDLPQPPFQRSVGMPSPSSHQQWPDYP